MTAPNPSLAAAIAANGIPLTADLAHVSRVYATPDHRVWMLTRPYLDIDGTTWTWDQHPYDLTAGPEMVSPSYPVLHMPLIGLVVHCGLHSGTTQATQAGELVFQQHDAAEAGLLGGTA